MRAGALVTGIFLVTSFATLPLMFPTVFAEKESLSIPARNFEQIAIYLNQGDELKYSIGVSGGTNDDISLTIHMLDGGEQKRLVEGAYAGSFVATHSGTYVFSFDNRFSLLSNKFVSFAYERIQNTFYIYVEELPYYADYAGDVVYDATEYWKSANQQLNFYKAPSEQNADLRIQWVKEFGVEHVGFALGNQFIEVGLGDSKCRGDWFPYSADHVAYIMKHEIGHILGLEHVSDPNSIMYPIVEKTEWGLVEEEFSITENYGQFVPFCTTKDVSAFRYSVETNDPTYGFDVYVVPSVDSFQDRLDREPFRHYSSNECFGEGFLNYNGNCQGVRSGAGIFVMMNEKLSKPLTTITVRAEEIPLTVSREQSTSIKHPPQPEVIIPEIIPKQPQQTPQQKQVQPKTSCGAGTVLRDGVCVLDKCGAGTVLKNGVCVLEQTSQPNGGGCLIATATYGSELAKEVQQLRELRDSTLLQTNSGSAFMMGFNQFYYSFSPTIADWERQNHVFKETVKLTITPLLTSLSILNYVDIDSEEQVLGYGIGIILLNIGMYFVLPAFVFQLLRKKI